MTKKTINGFYIVVFTIIAYYGALCEMKNLRISTSLFLSIVFVILCCILAVYYFRKDRTKEDISRTDYIIIVGILILGILFRAVCYYFLNVAPFSDFAMPTEFCKFLQENGPYTEYVIRTKELDHFQRYYSLYPAWGSYMLIARTLFHIFPINADVLFYLNLFLLIVTYSCFFFLLRETVSKKCLKITLLFVSFFPHAILWSSIATPDHITVMILSVILLLWGKCVTIKSEGWGKYVPVILLAFAAALVNLFKPLSVLLLLVMICSLILLLANHEMHIKKTAWLLFVYGGVFFVSNSFLSHVNERLISDVIQTDVQQATPFYILWGYSVNEEGIWDDQVASELINEALEKQETLAESIQSLEGAAKEMVTEHVKELPAIWLRKFQILFYSDTYPCDWIRTDGSNMWIDLFLRYKECLGVLFSVLNIASLCILPFSLRRRDALTLFSSLGWLGYILFLVAASIQTRYRFIPLMTFQIILTAAGIEEISCCKWIPGRKS